MDEKRMIDVDELREELGFSELCENCSRDEWICNRDCCYSIKDFCIMLDDAVERILERNKAVKWNEHRKSNK